MDVVHQWRPNAAFAKQTTILALATTPNTYPNLDIDATSTFQKIDGFGYSLTGAAPR
ncbi:MAG: hypothetical protein IPI11_13615 [Haliscomenobacter sp.]|nr:hypothetical protein [Haliscomenobacter sp.]